MSTEEPTSEDHQPNPGARESLAQHEPRLVGVLGAELGAYLSPAEQRTLAQRTLDFAVQHADRFDPGKAAHLPWLEERAREQAFLFFVTQNHAEAALALLYRYKERLHYALYNATYGTYLREDLDDLCHDTFVKILEKGERFDPAKAPLTKWLLTIGHYVALEFLRRHNHLSDDNLDQLVEQEIEHQLHRDANEPSAEMQRALEKLPKKYAQVILLFFYEGLSDDAIAERLGISKVGVRTRRHRALRKLRDVLASLRIWFGSDEGYPQHVDAAPAHSSGERQPTFTNKHIPDPVHPALQTLKHVLSSMTQNAPALLIVCTIIGSLITPSVEAPPMPNVGMAVLIQGPTQAPDGTAAAPELPYLALMATPTVTSAPTATARSVAGAAYRPAPTITPSPVRSAERQGTGTALAPNGLPEPTRTPRSRAPAVEYPTATTRPRRTSEALPPGRTGSRATAVPSTTPRIPSTAARPPVSPTISAPRSVVPSAPPGTLAPSPTTSADTDGPTMPSSSATAAIAPTPSATPISAPQEVPSSSVPGDNVRSNPTPVNASPTPLPMLTPMPSVSPTQEATATSKPTETAPTPFAPNPTATPSPASTDTVLTPTSTSAATETPSPTTTPAPTATETPSPTATVPAGGTTPPMTWSGQCLPENVEMLGVGMETMTEQTLVVPESRWSIIEVSGKIRAGRSQVPKSVTFTFADGRQVQLDTPTQQDDVGYRFAVIGQPGQVRATVRERAGQSTARALLAYVARPTNAPFSSSGALTLQRVYQGRGALVLNLPAPLAAPGDLLVQGAFIDNNPDTRILVLGAEAGGVTASVESLAPNAGNLLNIEQITLPNVPAGTQTVTVWLESPSQNGDSSVFIGATVSLPCQEASVSSQPSVIITGGTASPLSVLSTVPPPARGTAPHKPAPTPSSAPMVMGGVAAPIAARLSARAAFDRRARTYASTT